MNTGIRRSVDELLRSLRSSSEYRAFEIARRRLDADPGKRKRAVEFRRKNFLLQNSEDGAHAEAQEKMFLEREELHRDPEIGAYLDAELAVCRLLRQINIRLMDSVDLDLDSMEDILS